MVVHLVKLLQCRPEVREPPGIGVRTYCGEADIAAWLAIRNQAFAGQTAGTRPWTAHDFRREFLDKPEWRPEWIWFAETLEATTPQPVGTVAMTLAELRQSPAVNVSWLAVLPEWRRRGVGRQLLAALEIYAWDAGRPLVRVETRSDWTAAMQFYQSLGYSPSDPRRRGG